MSKTDIFKADQLLSNGELLSHFMPIGERFALKEALKREEASAIAETVLRVAKTIRDMPKTYGQDGLGLDAIVYLHYFKGSIDAWVTEKDTGDGGDDQHQYQAFGKACLTGHPDDAEMGYISIEELINNGVELDLYWTPKKLGEI